jgi:hypothetical protein
MRSKQAASQLPLLSSKTRAERTIAKAKGERKEKSAKKARKTLFFGGVWKSPLKMRPKAQVDDTKRKVQRRAILADSKEKGNCIHDSE